MCGICEKNKLNYVIVGEVKGWGPNLKSRVESSRAFESLTLDVNPLGFGNTLEIQSLPKPRRAFYALMQE